MNTVVSKRFLISLIFTIILFFVYSYRLEQSFSITSDFGRDIYHAARAAQGDLVLIGSKMNLGGYFVGPYFYYLLALPLLIFGFDINFVLYFHTFLFAFSVGFFFWALTKKFGFLKTLLASISIAFLPIYILSARYPSNGYSYLPFLLILFIFVFLDFYKGQTIQLFLLGVLAGIIFNIHPISALALIFIFFYILWMLRNKRMLWYFALGFVITLLPLLIFEVKHDLVMTKDTFINHSYRTFTQDGNTPQFWLHKNQIISSFLFLWAKFENLVLLPPIFYFGSMTLAIAWKWRKKFTNLSFDLFLLLSAVLSLVLLISVLRFHFENHYIFPTVFFVPLVTIFVLIRSKLWFLLIIVALLGINSYLSQTYPNAIRSFTNIEQAVKYTLDQKLIKKGESFNLIAITDAYGLVPTGYEYRFFFRKNGFYPNSEYDYQNPQKLLIFSETPYYDIDRFKMWATEQFGRQYFGKRDVYQVGNTTVYLISK